jgi:ribonuclease J
MKLRIIPLGGQSNVTKNLYVYEYWENDEIKDIVLIDCGVGFLSHLQNLGVDFVIPDVSYLNDKLHLIRALLISHGHDDHIGAVPYILPLLNFPPVYAPKLAALLIKEKLKELEIAKARVDIIKFHHDYQFGNIKARYIHMTHSIPDTTHIFLKTPVGNIYHGSDYKFDLTPVYGNPPDFSEIVAAGDTGVKVMLSDALGSEKEGFTLSERIVGNTFEEEMRKTKGRFFVTTFASNISRIKQAIEAAMKFNRKVIFAGRSMKRNMEIALSEGYVKLNREHVVDDKAINRLNPKNTCIILTGSQGEYNSALDRIASGKHRTIKVQKNDRILFSSDPIPGNEEHVQEVIENLIERGAEVIYTAIRDQLHASGHGSQGDHKLLARLVRPSYLVPIGTTVKHARAYADVMGELGYREDQVFRFHDGEPLVVEKGNIYMDEPIPLKEMLVDGRSIGDVGQTILNERESLGKEGVLVVVVKKGKVELISRGFVFYEKELFTEIEKLARSIIKKNRNRKALEEQLASQLAGFVSARLERSPEIVPVVVDEVK